MRRALFPLLLAASFGLLPVAAHAEDNKTKARAKADEALKLYQQKQWEACYEAFTQAEVLYGAPSITIYRAHCLREAEKLVEARLIYARLAAFKLDADAPAAFREAVADAAKQVTLLDKRIPSLRITVANAKSVRVWVDGSLASAVLEPKGLSLDPGKHALRIAADGFSEYARVLDLSEGRITELEITLEAGANRISARELPFKELSSSGEMPNRVPAYVLFGVGGLGVALGAVMGGLALQKLGAAKGGGCGEDLQSCPNEATRVTVQNDLDTGRTISHVSTAALSVGLASAAVGIILFATGNPTMKKAGQMLGPNGLTYQF